MDDPARSLDAILDAVRQRVFETGQAQLGPIQRHFKLLMSEAEALLNRLEQEGHISPEGLGGARIVYDKEPARSIYLNTNQLRLLEAAARQADSDFRMR